jgi:hypothetical protein
MIIIDEQMTDRFALRQTKKVYWKSQSPDSTTLSHCLLFKGPCAA